MVVFLKNYKDYENLANLLETFYNMKVKSLHLLRNMIGYVYIIQTQSENFILKVFRNIHRHQALQSIKIMNFLYQKDFPVPKILPTLTNEYYFPVFLGDSTFIGILYEFIKGKEPFINDNHDSIASLTLQLHSLMNCSSIRLVSHDKDYYIERFIKLLKLVDFPDDKIKILSDYGNFFWNHISQTPRGFCHGDLHSGNMIQRTSGKIYLIDFDVAGYNYPIIDIATICNKSDFNLLDKKTFFNTKNAILSFFDTYVHIRLDKKIMAAIFCFIAVRHYELIATISECQGIHTISPKFLDEQYNWIVDWYHLCSDEGLLGAYSS